MEFKKLALAAAVASLPATGFSMEALEDSALSGVTGQDGLSIGITTPATGINMDVLLHDMDGLTPAGSGITTPAPGVIYLSGVGVDTAGGAINLTVDADGNGGAAVLNVGIAIPTGTTISTGDISVAESDGIGNTITEVAGTTLLNSMDIILGATSLNLQLGNDPQGAMIAMNTTISGGITIGTLADTVGDFSLNDATGYAAGGAGTAGAITANQVVVGGADGGAAAVADIGANLTVDVDGAEGLVIDITSLGSATGLDVALTDLSLGTGTAIGDVELRGLDLNGTKITVAGH